MRYILNGKLYDTDFATKVARDSFGSWGDFGRWDETLFRTPKGNYFLVGEGGAKSRWGRQVTSNTWCGCDGAEALSPTEALAWCESHHVDAATIAHFFPDQIEEA